MSDGVALRTALNPEPQSLWLYAIVSLGFHAFGVGTFWGATALASVFAALIPMCRHEEPPTEYIEISMVSLAKSPNNVPHRAEQVKRAEGSDTPNPQLPPPVDVSDVKFKTEVPDPKPGNANDATRQQMIDELERQRLQELLNAPEGEENRQQSDPDGTEDAALAAVAAGSKGDPEMQRWISKVQQLLMQHFHPLGGRTDLVTLVKVRMNAETGEVLGYEVVEPSGVFAFDQAAERAVQEMTSLPLPPTKYATLLSKEGVAFRFTPP